MHPKTLWRNRTLAGPLRPMSVRLTIVFLLLATRRRLDPHRGSGGRRLIGESAGRRLRAGTIREGNGFFTGWQRRSNIPRAGRPYARAMHNQPKTSATLSPLFIEEERFLALAPTGLAAASRALPFAYEADSLPVAESSALPSGLSEVMEALADGGG